MKKLSKFLLAAVVALGVGLTACNNDDIVGPQDAGKGNTHVTISLKMGNGAGLRALPDDYNLLGDWAGNDEITSIVVFLSDASNVTYQIFNVGTGEAYEMKNGVVTPMLATAAMRTTPGWKEVYVLINPTDEVFTHFGITPTSLTGSVGTTIAFKDKYDGILKLDNRHYDGTNFVAETSASKLASVNTGKDEIAMTNVSPQTVVVAPNVKDTETVPGDPANPATPAPKNRVSLEVERAVARVLVTTEQTAYVVPTASGSGKLGEVSDITWVLAQGENSLFVQRKATTWETPNYGWVPGQGSPVADYDTEAKALYDYSGLYENYNSADQWGGTTIPTIADYSTPENIGNASILDGKFILATTHEYGPDGATSKYKKGNTAYVMVRAKFKPETFADATVYIVGNDFWLGEDGKFYGTEVAANASGQKAYKYVGGKVIYYAWVNPDKVQPDPWYNSPVIRNNIYHIHINGFKTIGTNWNQLFPDPDPDNPGTPETGGNPDPKPGPNEPENPVDPEEPLTTEETWMSVDAKVLPWKVHTYKVELGI